MQRKAQNRRWRGRAALKFALLFATVLAPFAACSYGTDDYTIAPSDPCHGTCSSCADIASFKQDPRCICGANGGTCSPSTSKSLMDGLDACLADHCAAECGIFVDGSTGSTSACTSCAESQCKDSYSACLQDTMGCPH